MNRDEKLRKVLDSFQLSGKRTEMIPYGSGHINDTYRISCETEQGVRRYILQRMNKAVFQNPEELVENVAGVTGWLREKILAAGGDAERETMTMVPCLDGKFFHVDEEGEYWRVYLFIEGTTSYDQVKCPEDFYQSAVAFGHFQRLLSDYPARTLHETIPDFHDTVKRFENFRRAVEKDDFGRASAVSPEIRFIMEREKFAHVLCDLEAEGSMPVRVTHNDTKLNNILIDNETGKAICVIDLDTVMPGLAVNDFGDSIRFGASTGAEDEKDLSKISCDLELYRIYAKGFIEGCGGALTDIELEHLPTGAMMMTFENGMRFLTDYLEGDHYFKIKYETHNLDRCRTQLKLLKDMEEKQDAMKRIVDEYRKIF